MLLGLRTSEVELRIHCTITFMGCEALGLSTATLHCFCRQRLELPSRYCHSMGIGMKNSVASFKSAKGHERLSMVTAYDYSQAVIVEQSGINAILVGDSLGMAMLGYDNTLAVTLDDMIHHMKAVARGARTPLLVCDMPYMSYQVSLTESVRNAGRLVQEGHAESVKLEGGREFCTEIKSIVRASIPVMGHLGLTPQSVNAFGGFKVQGKNVMAAQKILDDARALEEAGVFSIVLEGIPRGLAARITSEVGVPTIGIGAGEGCDGQVLVMHDLLGITRKPPKFAKAYANLEQVMLNALCSYDNEVKEGIFPSKDFSYFVENEEDLLSHLH